MLTIWMVLLEPTSYAATLEVALAQRTGVFHAPARMEVSVSLKGGPASAPVEASWDNIEGNSFAVACTDKGSPPEDDLVEQPLLRVGDDKWALAPGSSVHFTCPAGSKALVTDLNGTTVGTFPGQVTMTITKAKARAER